MDLRTILENASKSSAPSLKTLCLIRSAIELCNDKQILKLLKTENFPDKLELRIHIKFRLEWQLLKEILVHKLNSLLIPKPLKDKIFLYCNSIIMEIMKWTNVHQHIELPEEFCWTVNGTIDYENTAKRIILNETRCIKERYKLACIYCQETSIFSLWNEMPFETKDCYLNDERNPLVRYWLLTICAPKEKAVNFNYDDLFESAFIYAVEIGYTDAAKYLFYKLDTGVRQTFLAKIFKYMANKTCQRRQRDFIYRMIETNTPDTWFFLFTHLSEDLQRKYFLNARSLDIVLQTFLSSRRQKYLAMLMELENPYLNERHHFAISFSIISKYMLGCKDCNYRKLLIQILSKTSKTYRRFVLRKSDLGHNLFTYIIKYHFRFILRNGTLTSKGKIISGYFKSMKLNAHDHFDRGNWKFLLYLIKNQVVTVRTFKLYKEKFFKNLGIETSEDKVIALKKMLILIQRIRSNPNM